MKKGTGLTFTILCILGFASHAFALGEGTKLVALKAQAPGEESATMGPIQIVPSEALTPSKPVLALLHRMPAPTFSVTGIREEKESSSLGTKSLIHFQREGRI